MSSSSRLDVDGWKLWVFRLPCEAGLGDCTAEARLPGLPVLRQTGGGQAPSMPRSWVSRLGFRVSGLDSGLGTRDSGLETRDSELTVCELCTTMAEHLRSLRKFAGSRKVSDSDITPAKHVLSLVEGAPRR